MNWEDLEIIWRHTFYHEHFITPEDYCILLTEPLLNPRACRERTSQIMFETFNVKALYMCAQAVLILHSDGRETGVVLDLGYDVTRVVPVHEGYLIPHAIECLDYAGHDLTDYMSKLLAERGYNLSTLDIIDGFRVNEIKEGLGYVALDFEAEMKAAELDSFKRGIYPLAQKGVVLRLGSERFRCHEALFKPSMIGREGGGIHKAIFDSIMECETSVRHGLFESIVLAGGPSLVRGLRERLVKEMTTLAPDVRNIKIVAPPGRRYSVWAGGSKMASDPNNIQTWISREEYHEAGPEIVHNKWT